MKRKRYSYQEEFFKFWSKDMAYVLGFTFADGNIYHGTLSYSLSDKDISVLKYIVGIICYLWDT